MYFADNKTLYILLIGIIGRPLIILYYWTDFKLATQQRHIERSLYVFASPSIIIESPSCRLLCWQNVQSINFDLTHGLDRQLNCRPCV